MKLVGNFHASIHLDFTGSGKGDLWDLLDSIENHADGENRDNKGILMWAVTKEISEG